MCLALAAVECSRHVVGRIDDAHAPPAATRSGLEHDRIANRLGRLHSGLRTRQRFTAAWHNGNVERARQRPSPHLVPEQCQRFRPRADKGEALGGAECREGRVLRQKTVAGVNAVATGVHGDLGQRLGVEIGLHGAACAAELASLGSAAGVQRERVNRRVHPHRLHAQPSRRLGNANGDLTPIGDQYPFQCAHLPLPWSQLMELTERPRGRLVYDF